MCKNSCRHLSTCTIPKRSFNCNYFHLLTRIMIVASTLKMKQHKRLIVLICIIFLFRSTVILQNSKSARTCNFIFTIIPRGLYLIKNPSVESGHVFRLCTNHHFSINNYRLYILTRTIVGL